MNQSDGGTGRIDVHAHYVPDFYRDAMEANGHQHPDGGRAIPEWSERQAIDTMDRLGVVTALLSISTPGVHFGNSGEAVRLARMVNEEAARLRSAHPGRFGFFASLPLPDVEPSISELRYALDDLDADGIVLLSHHNGMYLGDDRLAPIYAEVAQRDKVVFLHPTTPYQGEHLALGCPRPMMEFLFETTRSVVNMILASVLDRHPDLKVIVPHGSGALPIVANRVELLLPLLAAEGSPAPPSIREALKRLHYDLAGAPVDELLAGLLMVADCSNLHYGSDYPFTPAGSAVNLQAELARTPALSDELRQRIYRDNAGALFPQLQRS